MSIKLQVEPYCQGCPGFEVDVHKFESRDILNNETTDTLIMCTKARACKRMVEYLQKQM